MAVLYFTALAGHYFLVRDISKKQMWKIQCTAERALPQQCRENSDFCSILTNYRVWRKVTGLSFNFPFCKTRVMRSEAGGLEGR